MEDCALVNSPVIIDCKFNKYDESPEANQIVHRSMIGSLLDVITSRPNIMQALGLVAQFQVTPK